LLAACLTLAAAPACTGGAKTPDEAFARFAQAVRAHSAPRLYQALDLETRWSWISIRRSQREAHDIVLSNFPEGPEREHALRRLVAGATSEDEAALFAAHLDEPHWAELARGLPDAGRAIDVDAHNAYVLTTDGRRLPFRRGPKGRWGYGGFFDEAEQLKRRAFADLELIRTSAADYERAATRGGR
jgi:hypothetical protein